MIGVSIVHAFLKKENKKIYAVVRVGCTKLFRLPKDERIEVVFFATLTIIRH